MLGFHYRRANYMRKNGVVGNYSLGRNQEQFNHNLRTTETAEAYNHNAVYF